MRKHLIAGLIVLSGASGLNSCKEDINYAEGRVSSYASVYVLKNAYRGADIQINEGLLDGASKIGGVVISNNAGLNFPKGCLVIQNTDRGLTRGLIIDLGDAAIPFVPGDSVNINVGGGTLTKTGNSLQVKGLSVSHITKISANNTITAKTVALGDLTANFGVYESTLVKIIADTKPLPAAGEKYAGNKTLNDGGTSNMTLHTQATAAFAASNLPASATYTAVALYGDANSGYGNDQQLRLRTIADVENASGPVYANWPESFETPAAATKASYNIVPTDNIVELKTGSWKLEQAILGDLNANRDRFNAPGIQCVRLQQSLAVPGYVQMMFDLTNGASKLTLWQGAYSTDVSSTFKLQYSVNSGVTWVDAIASGRTTANIATLTAGSKQETYLFNITGKVRFRVMKLGLGTTSVPTVLNGRLCIEDIAIYSN